MIVLIQYVNQYIGEKFVCWTVRAELLAAAGDRTLHLFHHPGVYGTGDVRCMSRLLVHDRLQPPPDTVFTVAQTLVVHIIMIVDEWVTLSQKLSRNGDGDLSIHRNLRAAVSLMEVSRFPRNYVITSS